MSMPINPYLCGHQLMRFYLSQQLESNFHHLTLYTPEDLALMVECEAHGDDADEEDFPAMWATNIHWLLEIVPSLDMIMKSLGGGYYSWMAR
ncbi:uncharacterized protein FPOAC1_013229 [Fusarium poae]|uniref:uncharacterized protein n=1 Tax=Fusarium poae TaxID=36050 RepID=UPI001D03F34D|nr:uncharacterized protein FPOAC1_013229 [Fusarium poae]KAG8665250.1 hypothetical protein FPOAC1_013229 [Fusarium poae]